MAADPVSALNHLLARVRKQGRRGLGLFSEAPPPKFVLKRSRDATRKNIQQGIQDGIYGFEVLGGKASGDAGVTLLRVVDLKGDKPVI